MTTQCGDNVVTTIKESLEVIQDWKFQVVMGGWNGMELRVGKERRFFFCFYCDMCLLFKDGTKDVNTESLWLLVSLYG